MTLQLKFQQPFDSVAYNEAKGKRPRGRDCHEHRESPSIRPFENGSAQIQERFPSIQPPPSRSVNLYDLTEKSSPVPPGPGPVGAQVVKGTQGYRTESSIRRSETVTGSQSASFNPADLSEDRSDTNDNTSLGDLMVLGAGAIASCSSKSVPPVSTDASSRVSPVPARMPELDNEPRADPQDLSSSPSAVSHTHGDGTFSVVQGETLPNGVSDTLLSQWPVSDIVGEEVREGELHYLIRWDDTLEPARNMVHLKGVLKKWNTKVQALREKGCTFSAAAETQKSGSGQGECLSNEVYDTTLYQWTVCEIVGEEVKDGDLHYLIRWEDTLEPARNIVHRELVEDWNNKIQALREKLQTPAGAKRPWDAGSDAGSNKRGRPFEETVPDPGLNLHSRHQNISDNANFTSVSRNQRGGPDTFNK